MQTFVSVKNGWIMHRALSLDNSNSKWTQSEKEELTPLRGFKTEGSSSRCRSEAKCITWIILQLVEVDQGLRCGPDDVDLHRLLGASHFALHWNKKKERSVSEWVRERTSELCACVCIRAYVYIYVYTRTHTACEGAGRFIGARGEGWLRYLEFMASMWGIHSRRGRRLNGDVLRALNAHGFFISFFIWIRLFYGLVALFSVSERTVGWFLLKFYANAEL